MDSTCKLFIEVVSNFQQSEEEITIEASPTCFIAKNYPFKVTGDRKIMKSQLTLA